MNFLKDYCDMREIQEKFDIYRDNLIEWNKVMNLTAITEPDKIQTLHFNDSCALLTIADFKNKSVIDIGTGAGFPGLPLKIAENSISLTLLDSLDKRISFLENCCEKLGLDDVVCIHARAEEIPKGFRENFDIAVERAVAKLNVLAEFCLPYVKVGGIFIAMKGPDYDQELEEAKPAIKLLGGKCEKCVKYTVSGTDIVHSAIVIKKESPTQIKYPRKFAQIKKNPL